MVKFCDPFFRGFSVASSNVWGWKGHEVNATSAGVTSTTWAFLRGFHLAEFQVPWWKSGMKNLTYVALPETAAPCSLQWPEPRWKKWKKWDFGWDVLEFFPVEAIWACWSLNLVEMIDLEWIFFPKICPVTFSLCRFLVEKYQVPARDACRSRWVAATHTLSCCKVSFSGSLWGCVHRREPGARDVHVVWSGAFFKECPPVFVWAKRMQVSSYLKLSSFLSFNSFSRSMDFDSFEVCPIVQSSCCKLTGVSKPLVQGVQ